MAYRVIDIKESVFDDNDRQAAALRDKLKKKGIFLLNIMSSPGSGKTTSLCATLERLRDEMKIAVMEADIDSDVDAAKVEAAGAKAIQLHTGGNCHLDAEMTRQGIDALGADGMDLVILENIGNLICPAEFDTGAAKNAMILSVPEGDDKPLKYPYIFTTVDVLLISKIDVLPYFDFSIEKCTERAKKLNPNIKIIPISARTGEGMDEWCNWIRESVKEWKQD